MNQPANITVGKRTVCTFPASILKPEFDRYHLDAIGVRKRSQSGTVVYWASGARLIGWAPAGTHDGVRDGEQVARVDMSGVVVQYCTAEDWIEAGNTLPA